MRSTFEERQRAAEIRAEVKARQKVRALRIERAIRSDWASFDELLAMVADADPRAVLEWAKAGRDKPGKIMPLREAAE